MLSKDNAMNMKRKERNEYLAHRNVVSLCVCLFFFFFLRLLLVHFTVSTMHGMQNLVR